ARRRLAHGLDRRLVGEEVAAVDGVVEVLPGRVALTLRVDRAVDAALRAHRVRAAARDEREDVDLVAGLGELDDGREPGETAADDDEAHVTPPRRRRRASSGRAPRARCRARSRRRTTSAARARRW